MNENLDQEIEELKFYNKEELEDELDNIREDYKEQIVDPRE
jgi:hypothetical protein